MKQHQVDLSRLEPFVHGLGKAILRELQVSQESTRPKLNFQTLISARTPAWSNTAPDQESKKLVISDEVIKTLYANLLKSTEAESFSSENWFTAGAVSAIAWVNTTGEIK